MCCGWMFFRYKENGKNALCHLKRVRFISPTHFFLIATSLKRQSAYLACMRPNKIGMAGIPFQEASSV